MSRPSLCQRRSTGSTQAISRASSSLSDDRARGAFVPRAVAAASKTTTSGSVVDAERIAATRSRSPAGTASQPDR